MSDEKATTPTEMFQEWVTQWEKSVDSFSNKLMGTDEFTRAINSVQNTQLQMQKVFGDMMAKHLANINMPSREDVLRLEEDLHAMDARLARMEVQLEKISGANAETKTPAPKGPPRTKRPPSAQKETDAKH
ncbi:MAG: hypothetical protein ACI92E_002845 [Oceanicoccus sp.]|jgi:hypothetical protein